jgi:hypothetical protein
MLRNDKYKYKLCSVRRSYATICAPRKLFVTRKARHSGTCRALGCLRRATNPKSCSDAALVFSYESFHRAPIWDIVRMISRNLFAFTLPCSVCFSETTSLSAKLVLHTLCPCPATEMIRNLLCLSLLWLGSPAVLKASVIVYIKRQATAGPLGV